MKHYVGTKHIKAKPMTWGEYSEYKKKKYNITAIQSSKNHTPDMKGYLIGYPGVDGKTFNGCLEEGCQYFAWSPKDIFEGVYKESKNR
jgi:hypothetical protein